MRGSCRGGLVLVVGGWSGVGVAGGGRGLGLVGEGVVCLVGVIVWWCWVFGGVGGVLAVFGHGWWCRVGVG